MSLADNIFIGGHTYAEASAASNGLFEILEYEIPFSLRDIIASQSFPMRSQTIRGANVSCDFSLPERVMGGVDLPAPFVMAVEDHLSDKARGRKI